LLRLGEDVLFGDVTEHQKIVGLLRLTWELCTIVGIDLLARMKWKGERLIRWSSIALYVYSVIHIYHWMLTVDSTFRVLMILELIVFSRICISQ